MVRLRLITLAAAVVLLLSGGSLSFAGVQYANDFENPSDPDPATAWPEWVDESTGGPVEAVNGRIEWTGTSNH